MGTLKNSLGLILGLVLVVACLWSAGSLRSQNSVARAASYTVCPAGPPSCNYESIQAAVDAAQPGDIIKVVGGTYTDVHVRPRQDLTSTGVVTQLVYISKSITLRGGYTTTDGFTDPPDPQAHPTLLDAHGQGRALYVTGDITVTIEGLDLTGGRVDDGLGGAAFVFSATVSISNSRVFSNTAGRYEGGGLAFWHSRATVSGSEIMTNSQAGYYGGGGIFAYKSLIELDRNILAANTGSLGGGASLIAGASALTGNLFVDNIARYGGGGLHLWQQKSAIVSENRIIGNTSDDTGGGLLISASDNTRLNRNTIMANRAERGGGLFLSADAWLANNLIADNQSGTEGSGLYIAHASPRLLHTTIARNHGGQGSGVHVYGTAGPWRSVVTMTNTILVGHAVGITVTAGSTVILEATLWGSGAWSNAADWGGAGYIETGTHNVRDAPTFIYPEAGDYHIRSQSAAIDVGVNAGIREDIDGELRPFGAGYDIGADEFHPPPDLWQHILYLPVILRW